MKRLAAARDGSEICPPRRWRQPPRCGPNDQLITAAEDSSRKTRAPAEMVRRATEGGRAWSVAYKPGFARMHALLAVE